MIVNEFFFGKTLTNEFTLNNRSFMFSTKILCGKKY